MTIVVLYPPSGYPKEYASAYDVNPFGNWLDFKQEERGKVVMIRSTLPYLIISEGEQQ